MNDIRDRVITQQRRVAAILQDVITMQRALDNLRAQAQQEQEKLGHLIAEMALGQSGMGSLSQKAQATP